MHDASVCCSRFSASVILRVTYGRPNPISIDDPEFVWVTQVVQHFIEGMRPGAWLVDRFHWLKYVPGYGRRLREYHESDSKYYRDQLDRVKRAMVSLTSLILDYNGVTNKNPSRRMMLARHSRERSWRTFMAINYPSMRCLSLLEQSSKLDLTRYDDPLNALRMD